MNDNKPQDRYYIRTFTGKLFYWDDIPNNVYDIQDIAHALSNNCRWTGHVSEFYSVAQHSVYASREVPAEWAMCALLHDAAEAYVHDTPSPLKWHLRDKGFTVFSDLEHEVEKAIAKQFRLPAVGTDNSFVKDADMRLLATEARDLMPQATRIGATPYDWKIRPLEPKQAEDMFLRRYNQLWRIQNEQKQAA